MSSLFDIILRSIIIFFFFISIRRRKYLLLQHTKKKVSLSYHPKIIPTLVKDLMENSIKDGVPIG